MRAATGLHGHRAGWQRCQEREELAAAQLLAKDHRARAVSPMELKDGLGEIESDGAHLVHGRLLEWPATPSLWHTTAAGGVHTIQLTLWLNQRASFAGAVFRPRQNVDLYRTLAIMGGLLFYFASGPGGWSRTSLR